MTKENKAQNKKTAAVIVIGNEILSGRTQDTNINFIAKAMTSIGVSVREVRVVPDVELMIIETVNALRAKYDYIFTTGGIGPTHDDITALSMARAFGVELEQNSEAYQLLLDHYGSKDQLTDARLKMADIPVGAILIKNAVTGAPGFMIGNVYVLAGVPKIMQGMIESILPHLEGGAIVHSISVTVDVVESQIAPILGELQNKNEDAEIGSYPSFKNNQTEVSVVIRSTDKALVSTIAEEFQMMVESIDGKVTEVKTL